MALQRGLGTADPLAVGAPDAPAIWLPEGPMSYADLAEQVAAEADRIGTAVRRRTTGRACIVLRGRPSAAWVRSYLAIRSLDHVPILVGDRWGQIASTWAPVATIAADASGSTLDLAEPGWQPTPLHPDLALLLSTSGSTGSPKLVRLSHENLERNAAAIAASLDLDASDVGITSLPLHYCYGLSVLHSHLAVGASVSIVDASVVDPCFQRALDAHGVTTLAGVPHTFRLLEAAGPERAATSSMRRLTAAGGRLGDDERERWRRRCAAWGIDLVVMYGQTEATARMAYLPPALEPAAPSGSIGVPIPGGELRVEPVDGAPDGTGELVYRGANVMLGYARTADDLARGADLDELRTGDLGRFDQASGTWVVVGRAARFVKPFGLRIDLDALEAQLAPVVGEVAAGGDDERIVVVAPGTEPAHAAAVAAELTGLPPTAVSALAGPIPRTESGKVDHGALVAAARAGSGVHDDAGPRAPSAVLADLLGVEALDADRSFVHAGGDSLSYVEASVRLERIVGALPDDWQHLPMRDLDALPRTGGSTSTSTTDTTVVLRAAGIATVVATHMHLLIAPGGAHLMLAVAGYNLSRFQLRIDDAGTRTRAVLAALLRVVVPTAAISALVLATTDRYGWSTVALVNNYLGPDRHRDGHWHYWFIEAVVQLTLVTLAVLSIPVVRRLDRARPFLVALALLAGALALRGLTWADIDDPANLRFRAHGVAAFFVLGLLIHRAATRRQQAIATVACIVAIVGFFDRPQREWYIICALVLLTWARQVRLPRPVTAAASVLASASLWIYLTHFHVWPPLQRTLPNGVAYVLTVAAGVGAWLVVRRATERTRRPASPC